MVLGVSIATLARCFRAHHALPRRLVKPSWTSTVTASDFLIPPHKPPGASGFGVRPL
jgi:hypothetical protein